MAAASELSAEQVADILGVCPKRLRALCKSGIVASRIEPGPVREVHWISRETLAHLKSHGVPRGRGRSPDPRPMSAR